MQPQSSKDGHQFLLVTKFTWSRRQFYVLIIWLYLDLSADCKMYKYTIE